MWELFEFEVNGRKLACTAILVDCVQDQPIPDHNNLSALDAFHAFITQRSQNALGKWPVHVILPLGYSTGAACLTGFRVHAKCCSLRPDEPEIVEYGILVWFQNEINVTAAPPAAAIVNWSDFAEAMEV